MDCRGEESVLHVDEVSFKHGEGSTCNILLHSHELVDLLLVGAKILHLILILLGRDKKHVGDVLKVLLTLQCLPINLIHHGDICLNHGMLLTLHDLSLHSNIRLTCYQLLWTHNELHPFCLLKVLLYYLP
jgi:hypothetical protein